LEIQLKNLGNPNKKYGNPNKKVFKLKKNLESVVVALYQ
jgi:hypothetical protein